MDFIDIKLSQIQDWNYGDNKNQCVGRYYLRFDGIPEGFNFNNFANEVEDCIWKIRGDGWQSSISSNRFEHGSSGINGLIDIVLHDPVFSEAKTLIGLLIGIQIQRLVDKYCPQHTPIPKLQTLDEILPIAEEKLRKAFSIGETIGRPEMREDGDIIIVEFHGKGDYIYARAPNGAELTCWTGISEKESMLIRMLRMPARFIHHILAFRP